MDTAAREPADSPPRRPTPDAVVSESWHARTGEEALAALGSGRAGLTSAEVAARQQLFGPNIPPRRGAPRLLALYLAQFKSPFIYLLLAAGALSLAIGEFFDAGFIFIVLQVNAAIGTFQEWKAASEAEQLRTLVRTWAIVRRGGHRERIESAELVPGDIALLDPGLMVPADIRLLEARDLEVDESLLTGESTPVEKDPAAAIDEAAGVSDRATMAHAGTTTTRGRAEGVVVQTGSATQVGRIAKAIGETGEVPPPLVVRMRRFTRIVAIFMIVIIAALAATEAARGTDIADVLLIAAALAVAAIPEGLPVALTVALAIAVGRMAKRNVIVRLLPAVEGLGACTLIASDKTGTLTCNELSVRRIVLPGFGELALAADGLQSSGGEIVSAEARFAADRLLTTGALCNEASMARDEDGQARPFGDTVDLALLAAARQQGLDPETLRSTHPEVAAVPYESANRYAASFNRSDGQTTAHVKGAAETVLPMCAGSDDAAIFEEVEALAAGGYRVLAFAAGEVAVTGDAAPGDKDLQGLHFVGLVGLIDPLRPEAADAVRRCRDAGVRVCMITGDHPATALAIARELGMAQDAEDVVTGRELVAEAASESELARRALRARVFARVDPLQKLAIVKALRQGGHFVAVTGDGANDAPALSAADIGIAMGKGGTDVARGAADLILTDDNFASIVAGIVEGRTAYDNVRKVIYLLTSTGVAEIVLFILSIGVGLPLPLTAVQLLWLNIVTQGFQHVALAFEKGEPDLLQRKPRPPRQGIFDRRMIEQTALSGLYGGVAGFAFYAWALNAGWTQFAASNALLLFFVLFENVQTFNCRSETRSTFRIPLRDNVILVFAVFGAHALHILAMHLPGVSTIIDAGPVSLGVWLGVGALAAGTVALMEGYKFLVRARDAP